jgi:hypothetical protein
MSRLKWTALLFPFMVLGCLDKTTSGAAKIPEVQFKCSSVRAPNCGAGTNGATTYVGLVANSSIDCGVYLAQIGTGFFYIYFDASGSANAVWDGSNLTGNVNFWVDRQNQNINSVGSKTYTVCAHVDSNGNGELDSGEPIGQGTYNPIAVNDPVIDFVNF